MPNRARYAFIAVVLLATCHRNRVLSRSSVAAIECLGDVDIDLVDRTWHYKCPGLSKHDANTARNILNYRRVFFVGNSVSRRLLYAVAHIYGGSNATIREGVETVQDVGSHDTFQVHLNAQGHCSRPLYCSGEANQVRNATSGYREKLYQELERTKCKKISGPGTVLGHMFLGTPLLKPTAEVLNAWADNVALPGEFDVLVVQVSVRDIQEVEYFKMLIKATCMLQVKQRGGKRDVGMNVILWGSPHAGDGTLLVQNVSALLALHLWPHVKACGVHVLDVTRATAEMIASGLGSHQTPQHFRDATRLMLADMLINYIQLIDL